MDQRSIRILERLGTLLKALRWQNTELRMRLILLEAELKAEREVSEGWQLEAVNWQQVALAAVAKAEKVERALWIWTQKIDP